MITALRRCDRPDCREEGNDVQGLGEGEFWIENAGR